MIERIDLALSPDDYAALPNSTLSGTREKDLTSIIKKKHQLKDIFTYIIVKKSIDARRKDRVRIVFQIDVITEPNTDIKQNATFSGKSQFQFEKGYSKMSPVVVGLGPAGLFAALSFARQGLNPIVIERGCAVQDRVKDIDTYLKGGDIKPYSNIQFGEGGAGTFSDGKLYSGINDPNKKEVLRTLVSHGAPQDILYLAHPHVGSDRLRTVIPNISSEITQLGGTILYLRTLSDVIIKNNKIEGIIHHSSIDSSDSEYMECNTLIIAPGHSARDTFTMLERRGIHLESKPFAVGVRIEHHQEWIDQAQYGKLAGHVALPAAAYKLAVHPKNTRALYSFCMCPGGYVIPSASDEHQVVTNGMSMYERDAKNANAALLVPVDFKDFEDRGPLSGMYFQQSLEKKAFVMGGSNGFAPCQQLGDFLLGKASINHGEVLPSYLPGVTYSNLRDLFPDYINDALVQGVLEMGRKIKCFSHSEALLTAVETRSSSPVRISRDKSCESVSVKGIFPCGEGAGYAGGIMSSAIDGMRVAAYVLDQHKE